MLKEILCGGDPYNELFCCNFSLCEYKFSYSHFQN